MTSFDQLSKSVPLKPFSTLRAGGPADLFAIARTRDELANYALEAHKQGVEMTLLGWGSNVLPSDVGIRGLVVINAAHEFKHEGLDVVVDSGCGYQETFLYAAQRNLAGLQFAVGIPGTIGGALVSNAGAYRHNIDTFVVEAEVVHGGERKWVGHDFFKFAYRHSVLRDPTFGACIVLRIRLRFELGDPKPIYDSARDIQRQRIAKQPPPASCGSFFKNVNDLKLAAETVGLTDGMRKAGVVPSGFLLEAVGFKGKRLGGAMFSARHANFLLNVGGATATELRSLADHGKSAVKDRFGVELEEEVLFLGDWSGYQPLPI